MASRDRILNTITVVIHCPAASYSQDEVFTWAAYSDTCYNKTAVSFASICGRCSVYFGLSNTSDVIYGSTR
jgi:hypothetical protein